MHSDQINKAQLRNPGVTRGMVIGALMVCVATFVFAAVSRRTQAPTPVVITQPAVAERLFVTEGSTPGTFRIRDAQTLTLLKEFGPNDDNFVRSTLKGIERLRRTEEVSLSQPFRLTRYKGGSLQLVDLGTGQHFELTSFGLINAGQFAELLPQQGSQK
jgi:putative photosynthetic complex assembly protein